MRYPAPSWGDNIVSVAQGSTATPGATKQLLPPDRVFKRIIYIYMPDQLRVEITSSFLCPVCDLKKNDLLSGIDVITRLQ